MTTAHIAQPLQFTLRESDVIHMHVLHYLKQEVLVVGLWAQEALEEALLEQESPSSEQNLVHF